VRVRVGDVRLYFDVAGMELVPDGPMMRERPIVICLHGGPGFDHSTLKPFLGPLEDEAQLIFLDHRGQGRSDESTPSRWNLDTWNDDVAAFCDVLGIERPIVRSRRRHRRRSGPEEDGDWVNAVREYYAAIESGLQYALAPAESYRLRATVPCGA